MAFPRMPAPSLFCWENGCFGFRLPQPRGHSQSGPPPFLLMSPDPADICGTAHAGMTFPQMPAPSLFCWENGCFGFRLPQPRGHSQSGPPPFLLMSPDPADICGTAHAGMTFPQMPAGFSQQKSPCRGTIDVLLQGRIYKNPIPVVPPCFAVAAHSRRNTNIFPATNVCPHVMKYCAFRRFLMPSVVHLRISVLPGFHLPGLSGSAPFALSPLQRFTFMKLVLLYAYFCGLSRNFRIFPIIIYFRNVF